MDARRVTALIVASLALALPAAAQPPDQADLTLQARAILRKYCAECHRTKDNRTGDLVVLDRGGLDRAARPFLTRGAADASQLLQLIEDGSMPPGNRPKPTEPERQALRQWVNAGAPSYPREFDDAYALEAILADVAKLPETERPHVRYFTLNHLILDDDPAFRLAPMRAALRQAVADLSKMPETLVAGADVLGTVFRVDLHQTGWDFKPFFVNKKQANGTKKGEPSPVNLFDVMLLEYPHARMYPDSDTFKQLAKQFLKLAAQVVPVSHVRGDWFADEFSRSPVANELRKVLALKDAPARAPLAQRPPAPASKLTGIGIRPLDSVLRPNMEPVSEKLEVVFQALDSDSHSPQSRFLDTDKLLIRVKPDQRINAEVVWTDSAGKCQLVKLGPQSFIDAKEDKQLGDPKYVGFRLAVTSGDQKERLTLFANESSLPEGELLEATLMDDRVVHRFYTLPGEKPKDDFDPARVLKKTVEFEIREKK